MLASVIEGNPIPVLSVASLQSHTHSQSQEWIRMIDSGGGLCICDGHDHDAHTSIGRLLLRVTQPRMMRYTNQSPTRVIGSHMKSRPIPKVAMMKTTQRDIHNSPNQNVRICQRKWDSNQVPRISLRLMWLSMTTMIEGQPVRNAPTTVAVPIMPVSRLNACRAYTTLVQVTSESTSSFHPRVLW